ncbi:hypothetical protein F4803DRAFT_517362 [Xylaria telfairii]|nr:hypothetical protein F4803DRAFT_517362 [Xylaria telfairii]
MMPRTRSSKEKNQPPAKISQACNHCRQKKSRCDGETPCSACKKHTVKCTYETFQRRRGPGRTKEYIRVLEAQLRNATRTEPDASHPGHTTSEDTQLSKTITGASSTNMSNTVTRDAVVSVLIQDPGQGVISSNTKRQTTGSDEETSRDTSRPRVPSSLSPTDDVIRFLELIFNNRKTGYPLLSWPLFVDNLLLDPLKNAASHALLDSIMAIGILFESGNVNFESSAKEAWARFNNAYIQLPQIIALGPNILAIEAMLTMALFMRMSADACTAVQLVSSAVRMYQMAALQNDPTRTLTLGASDDRHRRVFWTAYILDREINTQFGLPLAIDGDEFDVVPQRQKLNSHMQGWSSALQMMPEIAIMESIIYKRLYQRKAFEQPDGELITNIVEENLGLYFWVRTVLVDHPPDMDNPTAPINPDMETLIIHFAYYHCVDMVHWTARRHSSRTNASTSTSPNRFENERISMLIETSSKAARATLNLIPAFPRRSFVDLWRILCYPISASINLLTGVLENPLSPSAKSDVSALSSFRRFLERVIQEDGCDLHRVLQGCKQMEQLAHNAIKKAEAISTVATIDGMEEGAGPASWDDELCRQAQKIKDLLASCTHPMYLAQGLMTNMKTRDSATTEALSQVLGISEKGGRLSGLFAPECLWPKTNVFAIQSTPGVLRE